MEQNIGKLGKYSSLGIWNRDGMLSSGSGRQFQKIVLNCNPL